jgi:transcription-repair coupling factor (superfamily II helicase)
MRRFDPSTQRTIENLNQLLITPAREVLPGRAEGLDLQGQEIDEFHLPLVHTMPSSLLDYLPRQSLVVVDDLDLVQITANEIEEQSVKLAQREHSRRDLAGRFPDPLPVLVRTARQPGCSHLVEMGYTPPRQILKSRDTSRPARALGGG